MYIFGSHTLLPCSLRTSSVCRNSWTSLTWGGWAGIHCGFCRGGEPWYHSSHGDSGPYLSSNEHHQLQQRPLLCHCPRLGHPGRQHHRRHGWGWIGGGLSHASRCCNNLWGRCHGRGMCDWLAFYVQWLRSFGVWTTLEAKYRMMATKAIDHICGYQWALIRKSLLSCQFIPFSC